MPSELTLLILQLAFLAVLWVFVFIIIYSMRSDLFGQRVRRLKDASATAGAPDAFAQAAQAAQAAHSAQAAAGAAAGASAAAMAAPAVAQAAPKVPKFVPAPGT